jgi:hypothetical protein
VLKLLLALTVLSAPMHSSADCLRQFLRIPLHSDWQELQCRLNEEAGSDLVRGLMQGTEYMRRVFPNGAELVQVIKYRAAGMEDPDFQKMIEAAKGKRTDYPLKDCAMVPRENLAVIVVAGQSNASNTGQGSYMPKHSFYQMRIHDGQCYHAENPLLGIDKSAGQRQNFAVQLGDRLIESGLYKNVLLVPIAVSGTYIQEWVPGGNLYPRFTMAMDRLRKMRLSPTHVLWIQGEGNRAGDASWKDIDPALTQDVLNRAATLVYKKNFYSLMQGLREQERLLAPVFVAVASYCGDISPPIAKAQREVVDHALGIFAGPDLDSLGAPFRYDNCHLNEEGIARHAEKWLDIFRDYEHER